MHLFQLQPCLYQDVFHGSMVPYLHFNGFHANFLDHNNQTVSLLVCLYSDLRKIWIYLFCMCLQKPGSFYIVCTIRTTTHIYIHFTVFSSFLRFSSISIIIIYLPVYQALLLNMYIYVHMCIENRVLYTNSALYGN